MHGHGKRSQGTPGSVQVPPLAAGGTGAQAWAGGPGKQTLTGALGDPAVTASSAGVRGGAVSLAGSSLQREETTPTPVPQGQAADKDARVEDPVYDAAVTAIIEDALHDYQNIEVTVGIPLDDGTTRSVVITVAIPYWNNKYPDYDPTKPASDDNPRPSDAYLAANQGDRQAHSEAFGRETTAPVATAKGSSKEITELVQGAVGSGLIPAPSATPGVAVDEAYWKAAWKQAIEHWMDEAGVGLDCNGLVYDALLRIREGGIGARTTGEAVSKNGVIDTDPPGGVDSRTGVTTEMLGGAPSPEYTGLGKEVKQMDLRPGDVMYLPGHVRIVMSIIDRNRDAGTIEFTTAESTVDPLSAAEPSKNGPRMQFWKWDGKELLEHFSDQDDTAWVSSGETPSYREHLRGPAPAAP